MENYFDRPGISQSYLKTLLGQVYKDNKIGRYTDALVTNDTHDYVVVYNMPTDKKEHLIRTTYLNHGVVTKETIVETNKFIKYGNYSTGKIEAIVDEYYEFIDALHSNRAIISKQYAEECEQMAAIFEAHPDTQFLKDYETQVEAFMDTEYGLLKGKLDFYKPGSVVDFKTIASMSLVHKHFNDFRYDFQLAFYSYITGNQLNEVDAQIVFMSPDCPKPIVYKVSYPTLLKGKYGATMSKTMKVLSDEYEVGYYVPGFLDVLQNLQTLEAMEVSDRKAFFNGRVL